MANNARNIARNAVNTAINKAGKPGRILETAKPTLPDLSGMTPEERAEHGQALIGLLCKVTGGRKHKDEVIGVYYVSKRPNRYGAVNAMAELDGETVFVDTKYLEPTGDKMDAKLLKRLQAEREDNANATIYVACNVDVFTEKDKKTGADIVKTLRFRHPGWFAPIYFKPEMVTTTNAVTNDDKKLPIYEVPAWMIRRKAGGDAYEALLAKQDAYAALVDAAG